MKYLNVINDCKLKIEHDFRELALVLSNGEPYSKLYSVLSSNSFVNEFQLVNVTQSFYVHGLKNVDEDGIDISIGLFQIRKIENGGTSYSAKIEYDKNGDLILDTLFVSSDICTATGAFVLKNVDFEIRVRDVSFFEKELSQAIDSIFLIFKTNIHLMNSKLLELKNTNNCK